MQIFNFKKLGVIACALLMSSAVNATIITNNLFGEVLSGSFAGTTGSGSFSYDNTLITGVGDEMLLGTEFDLEFTIFGQTFTNADDIDYPEFPELVFFDGLVVAIDFVVEGIINEPGVDNFSIIDLFEVAPGEFETEVNVNQTAIPVPASVWLLGSGLLGLVGVARRKHS